MSSKNGQSSVVVFVDFSF